MKHTTTHHAQNLVQANEQEETRELWLFYIHLHGEDRLWWAYFHDALEIHTCLTTISRVFPCLDLKSLQPCPHGLRICSHSYPATGKSQHLQEAFGQNQDLFPLAPFACDYLASFVKGLGEAASCEQCQAFALTERGIEAPPYSRSSQSHASL